ncbi:hypothetical protein GCM10008927_20870 [Amylibacter ulvae]|uniref:PIN domain-containing protein n=2 Tax=Paramylibacter ulvae TaxID=1651968 RepID=A0ABQ3D460_9RHOB|nr:hypothetical protein GCM10008927_20870 [Amylibacter ulvae]
MLTVSCDVNVNIKPLRKLEQENKIKIYAVAIEGIEKNKKISNKELPIAVIGSAFFKIGSAKIASVDTAYTKIQKIIGKPHHGDVLYLEGHISSGRDIFVTDDNDFLSKRDVLQDEFNIVIKTTSELIAMWE